MAIIVIGIFKKIQKLTAERNTSSILIYTNNNELLSVTDSKHVLYTSSFNSHNTERSYDRNLCF